MATQKSPALKRLEKKIRKKYRRRMLILCIIMLVIGICLGVIGVRETSWFDSFLNGKIVDVQNPSIGSPTPTAFAGQETPAPIQNSATPVSTATAPAPAVPGLETPTATVAPQPTAVEATAIPVPTANPKDNPVGYGESISFQTEILFDGTPRTGADQAEFATLNMTMTVRNVFDPEYFAGLYSEIYKLKGDEAGVAFDLTLASDSGVATIIPQNVISIHFENAAGEVFTGYQLMDAEIAGNYDITLSRSETNTLYKRFSYKPEMGDITYMVVTHYIDGVQRQIYFSLIPPAGSDASAKSYPMLQNGDRNDDVKALQAQLNKLGYLADKADGIFGKNTVEAVKAAQEHYSLEITGIADNALQLLLFAEE